LPYFYTPDLGFIFYLTDFTKSMKCIFDLLLDLGIL
jgi:hypothetical protein